jgi:outer membrane protein assembly factor BamD (BamD/ComL family)
MNVSAINSASNPYQSSVQGVYQQRAQDFRSLQNALQSGDLSGAKQAFASLQSNAPNSTQAPGGAVNTSGQSSPFAKDFQTLQSALQSGDLSGAQNAFATLKQDMQGAQGFRGHHHHFNDNGANSTSQSSTSAGSGTGTLAAAVPLLNAQA